MNDRATRPKVYRALPLVWLGYLLFPLYALTRADAPPAWFVGTFLVGSAVFVFAYVRVFSGDVDGRWNVAAYALCLALFALCAPFLGSYAVTFLIYAASVAGFQARLERGLAGTLLAALLSLTPLARQGAGVMDVVPLALIGLVSGVGNHFSFRAMSESRRARRLQREKEQLAQTAERERIARDLHDLLGHTLSVVVLKSELAARLIERDPARAAQEMREVERISRGALSEVRSAVRGYRG
uniref:sensor histidine kinase n=1 Tax=Deinococcus pimensis TaxID=309888 RepID=UPI001FE1BD43